MFPTASSHVTATVRAGPSTDYAENTQCGLAITASEHQVWALVERVCDPPMMARYITMDVQHPTSPTALVVLRIADIAIKKYASEECARNSSKKTTWFHNDSTLYPMNTVYLHAGSSNFPTLVFNSSFYCYQRESKTKQRDREVSSKQCK